MSITLAPPIVSPEQLKKEIVEALHRYGDRSVFAFNQVEDQDILLTEYIDDLNNKHLIVNVAVPDRYFPKKEDVPSLQIAFMRQQIQPVIRYLSEQGGLQKASRFYFAVDIILRRQTEFKLLINE